MDKKAFRILLITPYFHPHIGGSQTYAEELYFHLKKSYSSMNVDVICYNTDHAKPIEKYRGFTIYRIPCFEILRGQYAIPNYFSLFLTLRKLQQRYIYNAINSHTRFFENSWWTLLVSKWFHSRSILTDHCANYPIHSSRFITYIAKIIDTTISPFCANRYDMITTTNKTTQRFIKHLGIKKSSLVYGGVDTSFFKPSNKNQERKIPHVPVVFSPQDKIVVFVGRMIFSKGPQILLEAAQNILRKNRQVFFIFAGEGEMKKKLEDKKNRHIFFIGSLDKKEIADLLSKSDILVHPSLHHEGFPNVLLEAGASACAVVATPQGGTAEIISNSKTGILVKPNPKFVEKALNRLLNNSQERKRLGISLQKYIKKTYDWTMIAAQYKKTLEELILE